MVHLTGNQTRIIPIVYYSSQNDVAINRHNAETQLDTIIQIGVTCPWGIEKSLNKINTMPWYFTGRKEIHQFQTVHLGTLSDYGVRCGRFDMSLPLRVEMM